MRASFFLTILHCARWENIPRLRSGALRALEGLTRDAEVLVVAPGAELLCVLLTFAALLANHSIVTQRSACQVTHVARVALL